MVLSEAIETVDMTTLFNVYICTVLVTMVSVSPVSADTSWEALRRFGLTGVWAYFCERPANQINYFETYAGGPNGLARREVDRGIDVPVATSFVENARIVSPSTLKATIRNADPNWGSLNNLSYDVIFLKEEDPSTHQILRFRFLQSIRSDGKILAREGLYFSNGKPTAWEHRCRTAMSANF